MTQVNPFYSKDSDFQQNSAQSDFEKQEQIVDEIITEGLPSGYDFYKQAEIISRDYNISFSEAKSCLRMVEKQIQVQQPEKNENKEKLNAQSGYFYPSATKEIKNGKKDGMDSLSAFASYNRMMFGF